MTLHSILKIDPETLRTEPAPATQRDAPSDAVVEACSEFSAELAHHLAWLKRQCPGEDKVQAQRLFDQLTRHLLES